MKTALDYVSGSSILKSNEIGISPSQLSRFFEKPHEWYRTQILGEEGFTGSTASLLGTIVHFIAESFTKTQSVDKHEIYRYIFKTAFTPQQQTKLLEDFNNILDKPNETVESFLQLYADHPDFEVNTVLEQYKPMGNALIQYLRQRGLPQRSEELVKAKIKDHYYVSGSCDAVMHDRKIIDYKTTSEKSPKMYIPYNYKLQLLCYAYIYKQLGLDIDSISIVWITRNEVGRLGKTGKPLKDYPSKVVEVTELITEDDFKFIKDILCLVAESIQATKEYPHLKHIIWRDYRLK